MTKKQIFYYDHGLPFSQILAHNFDDVLERVRLKKASLIIIDGGVGEGKTTLGVHGGRYLDGNLFDMRTQLAMGGNKFLKAAKWAVENKRKSVIYDEAGDFSKRGSLTKFNKTINRFFETYRTFGIIPIICLPKFWVLDNHLFDLEVPQILLHCQDRTENSGSFKAYDLECMYFLKENARKMVVKPKAYSTVTPNFYGHFLDLPPAESAALDTISTKSKKQGLDEAYLEANKLIDVFTIALKLDRSVVWVRKKIAKHGVKHIEIYQRRKYYDTSVLRQIWK